jgi:hypothetical protein
MASKRELIDTGTSKRYIRRDDQGRFTNDQVEVGRASASDQRQQAKSSTRAGQGDRADRRQSR